MAAIPPIRQVDNATGTDKITYTIDGRTTAATAYSKIYVTDSNATGNLFDFQVTERYKRYGDLIRDTQTGKMIPLRKFTKKERESLGFL